MKSELEIEASQNETQIKVLKRRLSKSNKNYYSKCYTILKEILTIRRKHYSKYPINALAKEDTICDLFSNSQVRAILAVEYVTKKSMMLVTKKVISLQEMSKVIASSKDLKNARKQNKFFKEIEKRYNDGLFKSPQLRQTLTVFNKEGHLDNFSNEQAFAMNMVADLKSVKKRIIERYKSFDDKSRNLINNDIHELHQFMIDFNTKKPLNIKPKRKKSWSGMSKVKAMFKK